MPLQTQQQQQTQPPPQQQQQTSDKLHNALYFSDSLQMLWFQLVRHVPASSSLLTQLLPGASLPLAVLRTPLQLIAEFTPGDAASRDSGSSSSSSVLLGDYEQLRDSATLQAVNAAHALMLAHTRQIRWEQQQQQQHDQQQCPKEGQKAAAALAPTASVDSDAQQQQQEQQQQQDDAQVAASASQTATSAAVPNSNMQQQQQQHLATQHQSAQITSPVADAWASSDVQQLQLARLASFAERLHFDNQRGDALRSTSTYCRDKRRLQQLDALLAVPPLHQQLFKALGMPATDCQRVEHLDELLLPEVVIPAVDEVIDGVSAVMHVAEEQQQQQQQAELQAALKQQQQRGGDSCIDEVGGGCSSDADSSSSSNGCGSGSNGGSRSSGSSSDGGIADCEYPLAAQYAAAMLAVVEVLLLLEGHDQDQAADVLWLLQRLLHCEPEFCAVQLLQNPSSLEQLLTLSLHSMMPCLQRMFCKDKGSASAAALHTPAAAAEAAAAAAAAEAVPLALTVWRYYGIFLTKLLHAGESHSMPVVATR
jgi:hypothetical protein